MYVFVIVLESFCAFSCVFLCCCGILYVFAHLSALGLHLGALGALLGALGTLLGRSWAALGALLAALGSLLAALGPKRSVLEADQGSKVA